MAGGDGSTRRSASPSCCGSAPCCRRLAGVQVAAGAERGYGSAATTGSATEAASQHISAEAARHASATRYQRCRDTQPIATLTDIPSLESQCQPPQPGEPPRPPAGAALTGPPLAALPGRAASGAPPRWRHPTEAAAPHTPGARVAASGGAGGVAGMAAHKGLFFFLSIAACQWPGGDTIGARSDTRDERRETV